ncbi:hypothetical protein L2E82_12459 [Cichorium intybus]|uniref:Uncharacterized protein n=1 Tax=Cichorium intybus TaxID=13427 RepID=A0ACB9GFW3_CICIN|nr:hypothetical protein L2E82_12459 [Cichorium intybus]
MILSDCFLFFVNFIGFECALDDALVLVRSKKIGILQELCPKPCSGSMVEVAGPGTPLVTIDAARTILLLMFEADVDADVVVIGLMPFTIVVDGFKPTSNRQCDASALQLLDSIVAGDVSPYRFLNCHTERASGTLQ